MKRMLYWLWRVMPLPKPIRFFLMWLINRKVVVGTSAIILNQKNEILLFKHVYRTDSPWGFPGGYLQKGEDPADTIQREILEESGMLIHNLKLLEVIQSPDASRLEVLFMAELDADRVGFTPSIEVSEARFFALDQLPELLPEHEAVIERYLR